MGGVIGLGTEEQLLIILMSQVRQQSTVVLQCIHTQASHNTMNDIGVLMSSTLAW